MFYYYALLASAFILWLIYRYIQYGRAPNNVQSPPKDPKHIIEVGNPLAAYEAIEPLRDFDWESTPPIKLRPFKPKYHLTMALETIPLSELIQMDNTYLSRIKLRRQLMTDHPRATLACNSVAETAALELYDWIIGTYLPKRFPTCFSLINPSSNEDANRRIPNHNHQQEPTHLLNHITSENTPINPTSPLTALHTLSSHIDTDFLILLPSPSDRTSTLHQPTYHLQAFATTFPSGFSTLSKLSLPLSAIHAPVPSYETKLEKSMDRFFARLPPGKLAARANWTITSTPDLFVESGTHAYVPSFKDSTTAQEQTASEKAADLAASQAKLASERAALDIASMRLRCERQTLFRLPRSGALVFAFKTYQYTLDEVKAEEGGMGEALAEATEGFVKGSVPAMSVYKREAVWGDKVREFLRG